MAIVIIVALVIVVLFCAMAITGAPYVPSRKKEVREAFKKLYPLKNSDLLIDLGSGDGKVLKIASAEFGAQSLGIELNPLLVWFSKLRLLRVKKAKVICRDFFHYNFPAETSVVYVFGDGRDMPRIVRHIEKQAAKNGHDIYLISHAFEAKNYQAIKQHRAYFLYKIKSPV